MPFLALPARFPLLILLASFVGTALSAATPPSRPNFLFVYTDDQRYDAMGVVQREQGERARFPWFKTPAMDRIAAEGVRFRNAFVTLSLCAPSRAAFLTSRYNHLNGVINNETPFPAESVTHASLLREAGYTTAYIGKWHMAMQRGQRPGFSYSASFVGQGKYVDCPFEINGVETPTKGWVDDVSTDYAIEFMKQSRDRPFSLVVGFKTPHVPLVPPARAKGRFEGEKWRAVPNIEGANAPYRQAAGGTIQGWEKRPTNLNYFRCVSAIDDCLGRMLDALDALGLAENTVVVFASDNGYYFGEHTLGDKRSAYDESLRIPLLVRYPKLFPKGKVVDEMVLNLDLAPTFLDLAGVAAPVTMQGRSWAPLVTKGRPDDWRRAFFYEYFLETQYPTTPTLFAVRTETAKLIKYPGHEEWTELFDLQADPYEMKNLARDPGRAAMLGQLQAEFDRQQKASAFRMPDNVGKMPEKGARPAGSAKESGEK
jgi:arylsulfatase A-like enzyme